MRYALLVGTFILSSALTFAQTVLPPDYFNSKIFKLRAGLSSTDTTQFKKELVRIADSTYALCQAACQQYRVADPVSRIMVSTAVAVSAPYLGKYKQAYDSVLAFTKLTESPTTISATDLLLQLLTLYGMHHQTADIGKELNKKIRALNKDYQKDNVSTLKGILHPDFVAVLDKQINFTLQQAQKNNNTIEYYNLISLLRTQLLKDFLLQQHALLQQQLYAIDPSRVEKIQVSIPMRDGVHLSAMVFRDVNAKEKQPAIVSQSPYPSGTEATRGNIFGSYGYVYVYVDCRGRRDSEGEFFPYENDARDYYDIIDWISKQSWCNGKVATSGGSYLGFTQWQAIRKQYKHPALKAINPMVSVGFGIDFPRENNIFYSYILQWAAYVSGKELNTALFRDYNFWKIKFMELYRKHIPYSKLDSVCGLPNAFFQKWISHPDFDQYWQGILPNPEDYAALDIPVLTITGYYDGDQPGALYYYKNHHTYADPKATSNHDMLIGPYDHGSAQWNPGRIQYGTIPIEQAAQVPIYKYVIAWFDWRLKDGPKPAWIKDKVTYFATGTGQWKGTPSFKAATADTLRFYTSNNTVTTEKRRTLYQLQPGAPATPVNLLYKHNITEVLDSAFIWQIPTPDSDSLTIVSPYNLLFETAPLTKDIMITDRITADLYVSLNVPDADFIVDFYEITPDGKSKPISHSVLRCRYRFGGDKPTLMTPGKVEKLPFNSSFVYIKKIAKGSRLRMEFKSINDPNYEKNYGFGGVVANETTSAPRPIEATIMMSKEFPSCIKVPIGK